MNTTDDAIVKFEIDTTRFVRAMHDVGTVVASMAADFRGAPRPPRKPYPRHVSGMTARQYRAARRRYGRERKGYKRALRTFTPDTSRQWWALAAFAKAAQPKGDA